MQNFQNYPSFGTTPGQATNYAMGGGGKTTTDQYRPTSGIGGTMPGAKKQQITKPQVDQAAAPAAPRPGVATQMPSPSARPPQVNVATATPQLQAQPGTHQVTDPDNPYGRSGQWNQQTGKWEMWQPGGGGGAPAPSGTAAVMGQLMGAKPGTPKPVMSAGAFTPQALSTAKPAAAAAPAAPAAAGGGKGAPTMFNVEQLISNLVNNPGQARRQGASDMFTRLTGQMKQSIGEDAAGRGLDFTSVPTDIFGRESGNLAGQLAEQEATASADDYARAVGMAQQFGQSGIDNNYRDRSLGLQAELGRGDLQLGKDRLGLDRTSADRNWQQTGFLNDLGLRDQDLQEMQAYHGMDQDTVGNRLRTIQTLMGIGDYSQAPLGTAVNAGFDYSGAMGQQAGGSADMSAQIAALLAQLGGGGGAAPAAGTPPFNPRPATFGNNQGGTYGISSKRAVI